MLGEKVGEFVGTATAKVLPAEGSTPKFETSVEGSGTFLGTAITGLATYQSEVLADGTLYGECPNQGVIMTQGGEIATFRATGAGRFTGEGGAVSFRGVAYFRTSTSTLARLNGVAVVYDFDVDADGNAKWDLWEWK